MFWTACYQPRHRLPRPLPLHTIPPPLRRRSRRSRTKGIVTSRVKRSYQTPSELNSTWWKSDWDRKKILGSSARARSSPTDTSCPVQLVLNRPRKRCLYVKFNGRYFIHFTPLISVAGRTSFGWGIIPIIRALQRIGRHSCSQWRVGFCTRTTAKAHYSTMWVCCTWRRTSNSIITSAQLVSMWRGPSEWTL